MAIRMARPYKHAKTGIWWLRARVPKDVAEKARGLKVPIPVGSERREIVLGDDAKVSLSTRDPAIAKTRFVAAMDALAAFYEGIRSGPIVLTFKQRQLISGSVYHRLIADVENEPGRPEKWREFAEIIRDQAAGTDEGATIVQEMLAGELINESLADRGWTITADSRHEVRHEVMISLAEFVRDAENMALRDYSRNRFPVSPLYAKRPRDGGKKLSFGAIIDARIAKTSAGRDAKPLHPSTISIYRRATESFSSFRGDDDATTVSATDIEGWIAARQAEEKVGNRTIAQHMTAAGTVWKWGQRLSRSTFPATSPFSEVEAPTFQTISPSERAFREDEAERILLAARKESEPGFRWLPFIAAYSGARISELSFLRRDDFRQVRGLWFFTIETNEHRKVKTENSRRTIPVHPALLAEGLMIFVLAKLSGELLFRAGDNKNTCRWIARAVKLERKVAPNHGWRHLMADLLTKAGASNRVRLSLTGRSSGSSEDFYGGSDVALPGLYAEIAKIAPIIPPPSPEPPRKPNSAPYRS